MDTLKMAILRETTWRPRWWTTAKHEGGWSRLKDAMRRDWEQTRTDFDGYGVELNQNIDDTVAQTLGTERIPADGVPNQPAPRASAVGLGSSIGKDSPGRAGRPFRDVEMPMMYGFGAWQEYGAEYGAWNEALVRQLRRDWDEAPGDVPWASVERDVRLGYERAARP
jgi:hypothetical protein